MNPTSPLPPGVAAQTVLQQGLAHHHLNQLGEARACYERVLAQVPDHFDAHYLLATALMQEGDVRGALRRFDSAVALRDNHPLAHGNRGALFFALGRYAEAMQAYDRAIELKPDYAAAFYRRGVTLEKLGDEEGALRNHMRALELLPSLQEAAQARDVLLRKLKRVLPDCAAQSAGLSSLARKDVGFDRQDNQNFANAFLRDLKQMSRLQTASAVAGAPWEALQAAGDAHAKLQQFSLAADAYSRALTMAPRSTPLPGLLLESLRSGALWDRLPPVAARIERDLADGIASVSPLTWQLQSDDPAAQLRCSQLAAANAMADHVSTPGAPTARTGRGPIRVAYLSADFVQHPVMRVLAEVFALHDRVNFELHAVAYGDQQDDGMSERLRGQFDHYHDVRDSSDEQIARHLRELGIDIAVDLMGYTRGARLGILARRPAPVSVNFLGYPGTLGLDFIDYIVGDASLIPADHERFYTEHVVRLPGCYLPVDRQRPVALAPPRAALNLPDDAFVFCAFSHPRKISPEVFACWMNLLEQVPHAVLWLVEDSNEASERLRAHARTRGIDPKRIVFAERVRFDQYLARYTRADLFLDTMPYNALATLSDALWAGLPAVTSTGSTYVGRGATSILRAAGLSELAVNSLADYQALALDLARSPARLAALKHHLKAERDRCILNDTPRYTRALEQVYRQMTERSRAGLMPAGFNVET